MMRHIPSHPQPLRPPLPTAPPRQNDVGHMKATGHQTYEYSGIVDRAWFFLQHNREPAASDRYVGLLLCLSCKAWVRNATDHAQDTTAPGRGEAEAGQSRSRAHAEPGAEPRQSRAQSRAEPGAAMDKLEADFLAAMAELRERLDTISECLQRLVDQADQRIIEGG